MPLSRPKEADSPVQQFEGPISVCLILLKYRKLLHTKITTEHSKIFETPARLCKEILNLLYNENFNNLNQQAIAVIKNIAPEYANVLQNALTISNILSPKQRLISIDYLNNWLNLEHLFIEEHFNIYAQYLDERIQGQDTSLMIHDKNNPAFQIMKAMYSKIPPAKFKGCVSIESPQNKESYDALGLYSEPESNIPYADVPDAIPTIECSLERYTLTRLTDPNLGLCGWFLKDGETLSQEQLTKIRNHVLLEISKEELAQDIRGFPLLKASYTKYNRTLERQVKCSVNECFKGERFMFQKLVKR